MAFQVKLSVPANTPVDTEFKLVSAQSNRISEAGEYEVSILSATIHEAKYPDWKKTEIVYQALDGRTHTEYMHFPSQANTEWLWNGKKYIFCSSAQHFFKGLGLEFFSLQDINFISARLTEMNNFCMAENLAGLKLSIVLGYKGLHPRYDNTTKKLLIHNQDGSPNCLYPAFDNWDAVKAYQTEHNVQFGRLEVIGYKPIPNLNDDRLAQILKIPF